MDFARVRIQTRPTRCLWFLRPLIPRSHLAPFFLLPLICRRPRHCRAYPTYNLACSISTLWYLTCYVKYLQFLRQNHKSRYVRRDITFTHISSPFPIDNIFINFTLVFFKKVSKLCTCMHTCVRACVHTRAATCAGYGWSCDGKGCHRYPWGLPWDQAQPRVCGPRTSSLHTVT